MTDRRDTLLDGFRPDLEAALGEPLIAACPFGRTDLIGAPLPRIGGAIPAALARERAGGLPERFLLALTPTRLAAYAVSECYGEPEADARLASWQRRGLRVASAQRDGMVRVAIEPGDGDCGVVVATFDTHRSRAFMRLLETREAG